MNDLFERGFLVVARVRGAPIRIHWTVPLGAFIFGGARFVPGFWAAFLLVVLVHELGHAIVVWRSGAAMTSIDVLFFGGLCRWSGDVSNLRRALIAWGGVVAQAVLIIAVVAANAWLPVPQNQYTSQAFDALTRGNALIIALNLLPVPPLDGVEAWPLIGMLRRRLKRRTERSRQRRQQVLQGDRRRRLAQQIEKADALESKLDAETAAKLDAEVSGIVTRVGNKVKD